MVTGEQIIDEGADFEQHRRYLSAVAYRLLGSLADAEDAVQDAWLRWQATDRSTVLEPRAYLTTVVTRICYDQLGSARARREAYFGEWLPEPSISTVERQPGPEDAASLGESVSYAMLAVMEQLSPAERVAFVLHDVFAIGFGEIAEALGRTPESVRQLASRGRRRVREGTSGTSVAWADAETWPQSDPDSTASAAADSAAGSRVGHPWRRLERPEHRKVVAAFAAASLTGDISGLMAVLDPDVILHSDGGGIVKAGAQPVRTADRVARLVSGLTRWLHPDSACDARHLGQRRARPGDHRQDRGGDGRHGVRHRGRRTLRLTPWSTRRSWATWRAARSVRICRVARRLAGARRAG